MKKILMTMMAAFIMSSAAFAQENKEQTKCCDKCGEQCKCEQCKCDKKCCDKKDKCCEMKCCEKCGEQCKCEQCKCEKKCSEQKCDKKDK